jgi:hypothetical protein
MYKDGRVFDNGINANQGSEEAGLTDRRVEAAVSFSKRN